jgi:putative nucleotidyltransferase with HDIG domain
MNEATNRWLAQRGDRVVGAGATPADAVRAAGAAPAGEAVTLHYHEVTKTNPLQFSPLLEQVRPLVDGLPIPVYVVGGAVRDALLGRVSHDLDLAVPEGAIELAFAIGDALRVPAYVLDDERDVGRVILKEWDTTLDIARFRGPDLAADLLGRDFTMNALALPVTARDAGSIIDLVGGQADIAARLVRATQPAAITDDPVRALRAVRQMVQFGFSLDPATAAQVAAAASIIHRSSPERIRDELVKLFGGPQPDAALAALAELGLLAPVLPEVAAMAGVAQSPPHHEPVLEHTAGVLRWLVRVEQQLAPEATTADPTLGAIAALLRPYGDGLRNHLGRPIDGGQDGLTLLRLGALFHDTGKPGTRTLDPDGRTHFFGHDQLGAELASRRLKALALSNESAHHVAMIVNGHMRPLHLAASDAAPSRRAIYRFYRATASAGLDIVLLSLADHLATHDGRRDEAGWQALLAVNEALLSAYFTAYEAVVKPVRLLTGSELIAALGLTPGPEVGRLLHEIEEAQAAGQIDDRESALALARQLHTGS